MTKRFRIKNITPSALQGRIDFDAVAKREMRVLAAEHPAERIALKVLLVLLAVLLFAYFYFVVASVLNIIARKEADAQASKIESAVGNLEQQYFALSQSITPQAAQDLGLAPVEQTQYVYRPGNAASADTAYSHAI
ncbi:MAG TPA: hypothetical protein VMU25_00525 [Candidatus Paceibacterota bacterium]|nr:hypothetical protein [Candidatus Paceibacterota bacterium]